MLKAIEGGVLVFLEEEENINRKGPVYYLTHFTVLNLGSASTSLALFSMIFLLFVETK